MGNHKSHWLHTPIFFHQEDTGWMIYGSEIGTSKRILYLLEEIFSPDKRFRSWCTRKCLIFPLDLSMEMKVKQL